MIISGDIDMMPEAYFAKYIAAPLAKHQERYPKEMQILLVPSLQDVIHETLVLPQPGFEHPRALALPAVSLPVTEDMLCGAATCPVINPHCLFHFYRTCRVHSAYPTQRSLLLTKWCLQSTRLIS
jgi:hypothetical protein